MPVMGSSDRVVFRRFGVGWRGDLRSGGDYFAAIIAQQRLIVSAAASCPAA